MKISDSVIADSTQNRHQPARFQRVPSARMNFKL